MATVALKLSPIAVFGQRLQAAGGWLAGEFLAERDRWALWLPVALGLGIGIYFSLPHEPQLWLGAAFAAVFALVTATAALVWHDRRTAIVLIGVPLTVAALGFAAAQVRTRTVATTTLAERIGPLTLTARIVEAESLPDSLRLLLDQPASPGLTEENHPRQVRIRVRGVQDPLRPGQRIRLRAVLAPPPGPSAPGAFDFQRHAYFAGLGAVGYGLGRVEIVADDNDDAAGAPALWIQRLRHALGVRVQEHASGTPGAIILALLIGETAAIPAETLTAIRDSGLAHLLSISGLHVGLVAAFVLTAVRAGLALIPAVSLRYPIKKWAAGLAVAFAGGYTLLAGAPVPCQRAFLMLAIVMLAVVLDRRGISMRLVAWAAAVILVLQPEALLGASFQMSFAAVIALVAAYESVSLHRLVTAFDRTPVRRSLLYLAGIALTTLVASTATTPLAAFHFNRIAWYGLAANLAAVPLTGVWIMPWAVIAVCLLPFGLDGLAFTAMAYGTAGLVTIAETVAAWPGAVSTLPLMPLASLLAFTAGGLWLCLWRRRWRWAGGLPLCIGLAAMLTTSAPDVLVEGGGKLFAVRDRQGDMIVSSHTAAPLAREAWLRLAGAEEADSGWPRRGVSADGSLACDPQGCLYQAKGYRVALAQTADALDEDCRSSDVVISLVPVRGRCPAARVVIDRIRLWREGTHAVWLEPQRVRVESANARRGDRPWVIRRNSAAANDDPAD
ncbi:MAG: ComEC/Rec2 family competence protein [Defluviicoccus sp.]